MKTGIDIAKYAGLILAVLSGTGLFILVVISFYISPKYVDGVSTGIDALKTSLAMSLSFLFGVHVATPSAPPPPVNPPASPPASPPAGIPAS